MSKPLPTLSQMPGNVKQFIADAADNLSKLRLRESSMDFVPLVDSAITHYPKVSIHCDTDEKSISVRLLLHKSNCSERKIEFQTHPEGFTKQTSNRDQNKIEKFEKKVVESKDQDYITAAVSKLCSIIGKPKVSFGKLEISFESGFKKVKPYNSIKNSLLNKIQAFLAPLPHQLKVEEFRMEFNGTQDDILKILPYMKPGNLKLIGFKRTKPHKNPDGNRKIDLSKICVLPQWKEAKELRVFHFQSNLPLMDFTHFSRLNIEFREFFLDNFKKILVEVSSTSSLNTIILRYDEPDRAAVVYLAQHYPTVVPGRRSMTHYKVSIDNSEDHIRVKLYGGTKISLKRHPNVGCRPDCRPICPEEDGEEVGDQFKSESED